MTASKGLVVKSTKDRPKRLVTDGSTRYGNSGRAVSRSDAAIAESGEDAEGEGGSLPSTGNQNVLLQPVKSIS